MRRTRPAIVRLMEKVDRSSGCWVFTGAKIPKGYGYIAVPGGNAYVHRVSYEHFMGPIPDGLQIDHLCRNTSCVNPEHLEAVTPRENLMRSAGFSAVNAAKTHCIRGHEFDRVNDKGWRSCSTCARDRKRAAYARQRNGEVAA